jgi:hypothetical protein
MCYLGVLSHSVSFVTILRNFVKSFYWKQANTWTPPSQLILRFISYMSNLLHFLFPEQTCRRHTDTTCCCTWLVPGAVLEVDTCDIVQRPHSRTLTHWCTVVTVTAFDAVACACGIVRFCCTNGCIPNCEFSCFHSLYFLYLEKWMWPYKIFPKLPLHVYEYRSLLVLWPHKTAPCLSTEDHLACACNIGHKLWLIQ